MRCNPALALLLLSIACGSVRNRRLDDMPTKAAERPTSKQAAEPERATPAVVPATATVADADSSSATGAQPEADSSGATARMDAPIAFIGGQPVLASELLGIWIHREPRKVQGYLQEFVRDRLVLLEARRLGVTVDEQLVDERTAEAVEMIERRISENGTKVDLDTFVRTQFDLDPANYRRRLREEHAIDLLAERCVRAWLLETERAEVRIIVTREQQEIEEVHAKLNAGANFEELARSSSIDASAEDGGRLPPVVRAPGAPLSRLAFATPVGQVGGPINEEGTYMLIFVESRPELVTGDWTGISAAVEASLAERGIEDPEYWQWKLAMGERYTIDTDPLLEYLGEL